MKPKIQNFLLKIRVRPDIFNSPVILPCLFLYSDGKPRKTTAWNIRNYVSEACTTRKVRKLGRNSTSMTAAVKTSIKDQILEGRRG